MGRGGAPRYYEVRRGSRGGGRWGGHPPLGRKDPRRHDRRNVALTLNRSGSREIINPTPPLILPVKPDQLFLTPDRWPFTFDLCPDLCRYVVRVTRWRRTSSRSTRRRTGHSACSPWCSTVSKVSPMAPQSHGPTVPRHHSSTVTRPHSHTTPQPHSSTAPQSHGITAPTAPQSQLHSPAASQQSTAPQLHGPTAPQPHYSPQKSTAPQQSTAPVTVHSPTAVHSL